MLYYRYNKGRKTLKNPSIRASVQPSSLKARETRNLIRGNRNGRVRRDNEVKERLGNNSPRVRAPNAVGCVSLKELKSLNLPFIFHHLESPLGAFLLAARRWTCWAVFAREHTFRKNCIQSAGRSDCIQFPECMQPVDCIQCIIIHECE